MLVLVLCAALLPSLKHALEAPDYGAGGSESRLVEQRIERLFPGIGSEDDALVFYSRHRLAGGPIFRRVIASVVAVARRQEGIRGVLGPYDRDAVGQISSDEHTAIAVATLSGNVRQRYDRARGVQDAIARVSGDGVRVWLTGYSPIARDLSDVENADVERAEMIGVPLALLILLLALGAPLAAMVPLLLAGSGLLLTYGVLAVFASLFHFDSLVVAIAAMIGLALGIDYALFIVSRFREELARTSWGDRSKSEGVAEAVGTAIATSGRTILFSGVIVALSLASLLIVDSPFFREITTGALTVIACVLVAALTLLPAFLAVLGPRINSGGLPQWLQPANARPQGSSGPTGWARWALTVMRNPMPAAGLSVAVLIVAAIPALGLHYGINLGGRSLYNTPSGAGEKALTRSFAPGSVSPIQIIVAGRSDRPTVHLAVLGAKALAKKLETNRLVAGLNEHRSQRAVLLTVVPSVPIDSPAASRLVRHIRKDLAPRIEADGGPTVLVGGTTAKAIDLSDEMRTTLPMVLGMILGLSLLYLVVVFRSVLLPVKAVFMNLCATGAALGIVVFVFQNGHGEHLLGFTSMGFVQAFLPLLVFALLFGVSMDYEVFLVRRMQEEWRRTHDNRLAVAAGIAHTARPITGAAAIIVAVCGSFVTANLLELKQLGFALAVAVALDATLIRLVLVPAVMCLLGATNWWLPTPLARVLGDTKGDRTHWRETGADTKAC